MSVFVFAWSVENFVEINMAVYNTNATYPSQINHCDRSLIERPDSIEGLVYRVFLDLGKY